MFRGGRQVIQVGQTPSTLNSTTANIGRQAFTKATGQLTYKCCHLVTDCESDSFVVITVITGTWWNTWILQLRILTLVP